MALADLLQNYGFSPKEAKIYLTCLEFGEDLVSSIARRAGENRITTYSILKELNKKNIANEVIKNNKKYYNVISAETLINREEKKYIKLRKALPELLSLTNNFAHKTKISYYEWSENVKEVFDNLLSQTEEISVIRGNISINTVFKNDKFSNFHQKRIQKKIPIRIIYSEDSKIITFTNNEKEIQKLKEKEYRENLIIKDKLFKMKNDIILYGKKKIIMTFFNQKHISCMLLESKDMFASLQSIFDVFRKTNRLLNK